MLVHSITSNNQNGDAMTYLRNCWYVAAWSTELAEGQILARTLLDTHLVFFRDEQGTPTALIDRCSHRSAKLSMGSLTENGIACPYHGFQFNPDGRCVHNPHGDGRIPKRAHIQSFPLLERLGAIWIWMGDQAKADPAQLPSVGHMDQESFYVGTGSMRVAGGYQLESDNILDLSHIEFVHPMFSSPAVSQGEFTHEIDDQSVWSRRDIFNDVSPPGFIRQAFSVPEGPVDRWLHVHWQAPAIMTLYAGGMAAGGDRSEAIVSVQSHWFTPETATSTHYFYAVTCPKFVGPQGQAMVDEQVQMLYQPFKEEDAPIIEAQQHNLGGDDIAAHNPIVLDIDAAGAAARRILARRIHEEQTV